MDIDLTKEKRVFLDLGNKVELSVIIVNSGVIRLALDNATMMIQPNGANAINLVIEK